MNSYETENRFIFEKRYTKWFNILQEAKQNKTLNEMIDQVEVLYELTRT